MATTRAAAASGTKPSLSLKPKRGEPMKFYLPRFAGRSETETLIKVEHATAPRVMCGGWAPNSFVFDRAG